MNFYNENDPKAAAWLRELIKAGEIPEGHVDERSITEIKPVDLDGFAQCHFFAGIGGWAYALKLAGWPESRPVWTASLPCQPFSTAGQSKGVEDERHLWPVFFDLIKVCRPNFIFGEQVARAIGFNWLDGVCADLEGEGYAVGQTVLGAHSVGAPHIRQRLYWMANANLPVGDERTRVGHQPLHGGHEETCGLGNNNNTRLEGLGRPIGVDEAEGWKASERHCAETSIRGRAIRLVNAEEFGQGERRTVARRGCSEDGDTEQHRPSISGGATGGLANPVSEQTDASDASGLHTKLSGGGAWGDYDIIHCLDGKSRRIESGTFPLAHGVPGRVGLLRGYGNAIVPQLAAEFIGAYLEVEKENLT